MIHLTRNNSDFTINPAHVVILSRNTNNPNHTDLVTLGGNFTVDDDYATITSRLASAAVTNPPANQQRGKIMPSVSLVGCLAVIALIGATQNWPAIAGWFVALLGVVKDMVPEASRTPIRITQPK